MKNIIILKQLNDYYLAITNRSHISNQLEYLYLLLSDLMDLRELTKFLQTSDFADINGNRVYLDIKNGNVYIGKLYCDEDCEFELKIPTEKLLKLIAKWMFIQSQKPKYILLAKKNNEFIIKGLDNIDNFKINVLETIIEDKEF